MVGVSPDGHNDFYVWPRDFFRADKAQIGLKLDGSRGSVDVIVIDRVDRTNS